MTFAFQASALPLSSTTELPRQLSWQGLNHTTQSNRSSKAIHNLSSLSSDKQADSNSACRGRLGCTCELMRSICMCGLECTMCQKPLPYQFNRPCVPVLFHNLYQKIITNAITSSIIASAPTSKQAIEIHESVICNQATKSTFLQQTHIVNNEITSFKQIGHTGYASIMYIQTCIMYVRTHTLYTRKHILHVLCSTSRVVQTDQFSLVF